MVQNLRFKRCALCQWDAKGSSRDVGRPWVRVGKPQCQVSVFNFQFSTTAFLPTVMVDAMWKCAACDKIKKLDASEFKLTCNGFTAHQFLRKGAENLGLCQFGYSCKTTYVNIYF